MLAKYTYGKWNRQVQGDTIDTRVYHSLRDQFASDIHNAALFYHLELSRYHVLAVDLVAPIDHYFQIKRRVQAQKGRNLVPAGSFDHAILAMGIHLVRIHGAESVLVVSADDRLLDVLNKCRGGLPARTISKLGIDKASERIGIQFSRESFPIGVNLKSARTAELKDAFGDWPLPVPRNYRGFSRPYLATSGNNPQKARNYFA